MSFVWSFKLPSIRQHVTFGHPCTYERSSSNAWTNHWSMVGLGGWSAKSLMEAHCGKSSPYVVSWPARGIPFTYSAPMVCLKWYGGIDIGSLRLPSPSGSTLITVGLLKNACGPMLSQCCAMWCDGDRLREDRSSAILGLSFKCTLKLSLAIWFALTFNQLCKVPWTLCTYRLRGSRMIR